MMMKASRKRLAHEVMIDSHSVATVTLAANTIRSVNSTAHPLRSKYIDIIK